MMRLSIVHKIIFAFIFAIPASCAFGQGQPRVNVRPVTVQLPKVVVLVDGKMIDAESIQVTRVQQVMVWLRDLEEIGWGTTQPGQPGQFVFKAKNSDVTLTFIKGQSVALVNSLAVQLPVSTEVRSGKLMVPLSFVAKSLGYKYECDYKLIASVITAPAKNTADNTFHGLLIFNGKPMRGIKVRAADTKFNSVPGAITVTDADGRYRIEDLPDGEYVAYVFSGDNPKYISRASEPVKLEGGQSAEVKPFSLIRAIAPISPKPGGVARVYKGQVGFSWSKCEEAASYKLVIKKHGKPDVVAQINSTKPKAALASSKFIPDVTYDARVTALDANGKTLGTTAGAAGVDWTFTVEWPM